MKSNNFIGLKATGETQVNGARMNRNENLFVDRSISFYPSLVALRKNLAVKHGVEPEHVVIGAGATGVLNTIAHAIFNPLENLQCERFTYSPMERIAKTYGCVVNAPMHARVTHRYFVNPNNVTGLALVPALVPNCNGITIVDEAYIEYCPQIQTFATRIWRENRLVVVRTFSKYYGLAGLRIGYGICSADIAEHIQKAEIPYCISSVSVDRAIQCLSGELDGELEIVADKTRIALDYLYKGLLGLGYETMIPCANFLTAKVPAVEGFDTRDLEFLNGLPGWRRITVGPIKLMEDYLGALQLIGMKAK